jgi:hypothetical protein
MKRNLIGSLSIAVLSLLLSSTGAYAQSAMKATVPFAFNVGSSQLPAGRYIIKVDPLSDRVTIQNFTTCATIWSHGQPEYPGEKTEKMVFRHVGDQYFLTEVWGAQGSSGMMLRAPKAETRMWIAKDSPDSNNDVMIALK